MFKDNYSVLFIWKNSPNSVEVFILKFFLFFIPNSVIFIIEQLDSGAKYFDTVVISWQTSCSNCISSCTKYLHMQLQFFTCLAMYRILTLYRAGSTLERACLVQVWTQIKIVCNIDCIIFVIIHRPFGSQF